MTTTSPIIKKNLCLAVLCKLTTFALQSHAEFLSIPETPLEQSAVINATLLSSSLNHYMGLCTTFCDTPSCPLEVSLHGENRLICSVSLTSCKGQKHLSEPDCPIAVTCTKTSDVANYHFDLGPDRPKETLMVACRTGYVTQNFIIPPPRVQVHAQEPGPEYSESHEPLTLSCGPDQPESTFQGVRIDGKTNQCLEAPDIFRCSCRVYPDPEEDTEEIRTNFYQWRFKGCRTYFYLTQLDPIGATEQFRLIRSGPILLAKKYSDMQVATLIATPESQTKHCHCYDFAYPDRNRTESIIHGAAKLLENPPLLPGETLSISFLVPQEPGSSVSFAEKFVETNDYFIGFYETGLTLFDEQGQPIYTRPTDITEAVRIWDAGTEADQKPGIGSGQPLAGNRTVDADPMTTVRLATDPFNVLHQMGFPEPCVSCGLDEGLIMITPRFTCIPPAIPVSGNLQASNSLQVHIIPERENIYKLTIKNIGAGFLPNPGCKFINVTFGGGVIVTHTGGNPIFTQGLEDYGEGLEALAEDGETSQLLEQLHSSISISYSIGSGSISSTSTTAIITASPTPIPTTPTVCSCPSSGSGQTVSNTAFAILFIAIFIML